MNNYIIVFLAFFILTGCNQNEKPNDVNKPKGRLTKQHPDDSLAIHYRKNGNILSEVIYRNGKKNGLGINYYENGSVHSEISFKNNQKHGPAKWYYENGEVYSITTYYKDMKHGIAKKYDKKGKLISEIPYQYGELQEGTKEYDTNGKLIDNYPVIVFSTVDRISLNGKFQLKISLSDKRKNVEFKQLVFNQQTNDTLRVYIDTNKGSGNLIFNVAKGTFMMHKLEFIAITKTKRKNPLLLKATYNLAIENR